MAFLGKLADVLWNPWLLGLFLLTGAVLTVGGSFSPCGISAYGGGRQWKACSALKPEGAAGASPPSRR